MNNAAKALDNDGGYAAKNGLPTICNHRKLTIEKQFRFLEVLADTANVSRAAREIDMSRTVVYQERRENALFAKAWDEAVELGTRHLEDEAVRRAAEGTLKPVFHQGQQCGVIREFSDTLLIFMLKARDPRYREHASLSVTGANGGPLQSVALVTNDPVAAAAAYQEMLRGGEGE